MLLDRSAALKLVPALAGLGDSSLRHLASSCVWRQCKAGTFVLEYQAPSTDVFFIVAGKARAMIYAADGKAVVFRDLKPGSMFGELSAIDLGVRSAAIEALEECTVACLDAAQFEHLLSHEPSVALATLRQLAGDVRRLSERIHEFSTMVVQNRIQAELLRLAAETGPRKGNAPLLDPAPSLTDIAERISTHREGVSRELSRLTSIGILKREGTGLRISNLASLEELVREAKGAW